MRWFNLVTLFGDLFNLYNCIISRYHIGRRTSRLDEQIALCQTIQMTKFHTNKSSEFLRDNLLAYMNKSSNIVPDSYKSNKDTNKLTYCYSEGNRTSA